MTKAFFELNNVINAARTESFALWANTQDARIVQARRSRLRVQTFDLKFGKGGTQVTYDIRVRWKTTDELRGKELYIHLYRAIGQPWLPARQWVREHLGKDVIGPAKLESYIIATGRPFNYVGLPKELQLMVLGALIGPTIWPRAKVECRRCCDADHSGATCGALKRVLRYARSIYDELAALLGEHDVSQSGYHV